VQLGTAPGVARCSNKTTFQVPVAGLSCLLQAENVEMLEDSRIKFDFLGKDSVRYENTVAVAPEVWQNMKAFKSSDCNGKAKKPDGQLFDAMAAQVGCVAFHCAVAVTWKSTR
jgi:hypothetical protein